MTAAARQTTSVRFMPKLRSVRSSTASATAGSVKLGQPVPESNFASEANSGAPQPAQLYMPGVFSLTYGPVKARSVPCLRRTSYCSGVSDARHSSSVFVIGVMSVFSMTIRLAPRCYEDLNFEVRRRAIVRANDGICAACAIASSTRSPCDSSAWTYSASAPSRPK